MLGSVDIRFPDQTLLEELQAAAAKIAEEQEAGVDGKKIEQGQDEDLRTCGRYSPFAICME